MFLSLPGQSATSYLITKEYKIVKSTKYIHSRYYLEVVLIKLTVSLEFILTPTGVDVMSL